MRKTCLRPNCTNLAGGRSKGYCKKHYAALDTKPVDPEIVARRVELLRSKGYSIRHLARTSGVDQETIRGITKGTKAFVLRSTADKVMAVPVPVGFLRLENPRCALLVSNVGTRRRLQGLMAMGHPQTVIAKELNVTPQAVAYWARCETVTAATAMRIRELFDRLQLLPGTDKRARTYALRKGWVPAWAWDEDELDDPDAIPHMVKGQKGDWVPRMLEYRDLGLSVRTMAQMEGVSTHTIYNRLDRLKDAA